VAGDADKRLGQEDIEKLLSQAGKLSGPVPKQPPTKEKPNPDPVFPGEGEMLPRDMEFLLGQAERALASIDSETSAGLPPDVTAFRLEEFAGAPASAESATLDLIRDVELDLKIELGRTHMYLEDVLKLRRGSVVPLDKLAGDPVDIYVNGRLIARGEVLVLNDNFCVRVAELIAGAKPAA
jgi:flagellar motor switch protein FliN/FliY